MSKLTFTVTIPTDNGFVGRECNSPKCGRYFKVHQLSLRDRMYCPYCGIQFGKEVLFTREQTKYIRAQAGERAKEYMYGEIDRVFGDLARRFRRGPIQFKHRPIYYRAKRIVPKYHEREVDSQLTCPECDAQFQVLGVFGYCPGCRTENQLIYDANLSIIRNELSAASDQGRALRHAYSDLVSSFEGFCKRSAPANVAGTNFQDIFQARRAFKKQSGIDILDGIQAPDLLALRRVFQKRHAHLHNNGQIDERYVQKVPEDSSLLGQTAKLSVDEFEAAARALRSVIDLVVLARAVG